jgi:hypothetical protein
MALQVTAFPRFIEDREHDAPAWKGSACQARGSGGHPPSISWADELE